MTPAIVLDGATVEVVRNYLGSAAEQMRSDARSAPPSTP